MPSLPGRLPRGGRPTRGKGFLETSLARLRMRAALAALAPGPGDDLLDIGCGERAWLLRHSPGARKVGLDPLAPDAMADGVETRRFAWAPGAVLPFPDGAFSRVVSLAVLEHLDPAGVPGLLSEARRVLRPGGRLALSTPHAAAEPLLRALTALGLLSREEIEEHQSHYRPADLRALLRDAGFPAGGIRLRGLLGGANILALAER